MVWLWIAAAALAALSLITLCLLFAERADDRRLTRELAAINDEPTNRMLSTAIPSASKRSLILEINRTLSARQEQTVGLEIRERNIRHNIENVSHDLRTPLTAVIGYFQLIESESDPEIRRQYFDVVKKRAANLQDFIVSYYDLSRLEAGEYAMRPEPVNVVALVLDAAASFYGDFEARGLEPGLEVDVAQGSVLTDRAAAVRICDNLIHNALKYCRKCFRITIRREPEAPDILLTEFCNDCPALAAGEASRIFDRFYVGERVRTGENTGIGLAVVKSLADSLGHDVSASVEEGLLTIAIRWKLVS